MPIYDDDVRVLKRYSETSTKLCKLEETCHMESVATNTVYMIWERRLSRSGALSNTVK